MLSEYLWPQDAVRGHIIKYMTKYTVHIVTMNQVNLLCTRLFITYYTVCCTVQYCIELVLQTKIVPFRFRTSKQILDIFIFSLL